MGIGYRLDDGVKLGVAEKYSERRPKQ